MDPRFRGDDGEYAPLRRRGPKQAFRPLRAMGPRVRKGAVSPVIPAQAGIYRFVAVTFLLDAE